MEVGDVFLPAAAAVVIVLAGYAIFAGIFAAHSAVV